MTFSKDGLSARAHWAADQPISLLMHKALAQPQLVSLAAGFVDQASLPAEATRSAALSVLSDPIAARAALQYGSNQGDDTLRQQVLTRLLAADAADPRGPSRRPDPTLDQVVLTAGSNQLLYLIADALLDPGDIVLCDAPTYFVFTGIVRNMGARCIGIATDDHGMRIDALEAELERHARRGELDRIKAIYVMSYFDNPRAMSLDFQRRASLVSLAKRYSRSQPLYVIEDAAYRELHFGEGDQVSLHAYDASGEHVAYAGTFSKSFSPGLRVGYGVLPRALAAAVLDIKGNFDFGSPHWNQRVISEAMRLGLYEPHVALLRSLYARKAAVMVEALDEHVGRAGLCRYTRPEGGLYVWLEVLTGVDTGVNGPLFERAIEEGVLYVPGAYCFSEDADSASGFMRLSFGVQSEERIADGIAKLARALRSCA
jgi:2-aminoadipate transaminase